MNLLWIGDPWKKINNKTESTIRLITETVLMGHKNWHADHHSIGTAESGLEVLCSPVTKKGRNSLTIGNPLKSNLKEFQKIIIRTDPPFDDAYRSKLEILESYTSKYNNEFINNLNCLLTISSKIACMNFSRTPKTIVSADRELMFNFCSHEKKVVLKPLYSGASIGVKLAKWTSKMEIHRCTTLLSKATSGYKDPIVLQEFIPQFYDQEIRVWFARGRQVGVIKKITNPKDFPFRIEKGGSLVKVNISAEQERSIAALQEFLANRNIVFAAADMIGDMIIDLNIGSPGLIVEAEKILKINLAKKIATRLFNV